MSALWIGVLVAVAITVYLVRSWRRRLEMADHGTVSEQWLAEQRVNDRHYTER